jgi:hypothetical protein
VPNVQQKTCLKISDATVSFQTGPAFIFKVLSVVNIKTVLRDVKQRYVADKHQSSEQICYLYILPKDGKAAINVISCAPAHQMTLH